MKNKKIKEELLKLNFKIESIGTIYWIECIRIMMKNPLIYNMGEIYIKVAKKHKTTPTAIERLMRYALEPAKKYSEKI